MTPRDDLWLDEVTDPRVRALLGGLTGPPTEAELAGEHEIVAAMAQVVQAQVARAEVVRAGRAGRPPADDPGPTIRDGHGVRRAVRRVAVVAGVVAVSCATAAAASEIVTSLGPGDRWPERPPSVRPEAPPADEGPATEVGGDEGPTPAATDDPPSTVPPGSAPTTTTTTTTTGPSGPEGRPATGPPATPNTPSSPGPPEPPEPPGHPRQPRRRRGRSRTRRSTAVHPTPAPVRPGAVPAPTSGRRVPPRSRPPPAHPDPPGRCAPR